MSKKETKPETKDDVKVEEHTPTPDEAKAMFAENHGLAAVFTTEGMKLRHELT